MEVLEIDIDKIIPDKNQPRKIFDDEKIQELAMSISAHGLLSPVIVNKTGQNFVLVAGERRYRACKKLDMKKIPAIVKEDQDYQVMSLIENIQRENLTPMEEAIAIADIKDKKGYTQDEVAQKIGKTRVYVANKLRLLKLDEKSQRQLREGKITEGHAKALLSEKDLSKRELLLDKILTGNLSVRDVENYAKNDKSKSKQEEIESAQNILEDALATKVDIKGNQTKGTISIEYYSSQELRAIVEKIIGINGVG